MSKGELEKESKPINKTGHICETGAKRSAQKKLEDTRAGANRSKSLQPLDHDESLRKKEEGQEYVRNSSKPVEGD